MHKPILGLLIVLFSSVSVLADYVAERKVATELVRTGKQEEATAAFRRMAGTAKSDFQKSDALEQAVLCLIGLKRYDQAMETAQQIPLAPESKTCQMRVLAATRKWQELANRFEQEAIDTWPEGVDAEAFFLRGQAHYVVKNAEKAEADLKKAAEYLTEDNNKGLALNALGDTYQHLLKDDVRAIEAYRRVYQTRNIAKQTQAAISIASILRRQNRLDDALEELQKIELDKLSWDYWRGAMLHALGVTLAQQGKKAEATSQFKEALQLQGISPGQKEACLEEVKKLGGGVQ
jgi:tetratricopeptide (TPR) repeat protein